MALHTYFNVKLHLFYTCAIISGIGGIYMAKKLCGECCYMDTCKESEGKFWCEKNKFMQFANSTDADDCRGYCPRFRCDAYKGEEAIRKSTQYIEAHREYIAWSPFYITTAVVAILGHNYTWILPKLYDFREKYLETNPEYLEFLVEYDAIGPLLADKLFDLPNAVEFALDVFRIYLLGTLRYIEKDENEKAFQLYLEMVDNLKKELMANYQIPAEVYDRYDVVNSGHGIVALK